MRTFSRTLLGAGVALVTLLAPAAAAGQRLGDLQAGEMRNPCADCFFPAWFEGAAIGTGVTVLTTSVGGIVGLARRERWKTVYRAPDAR